MALLSIHPPGLLIRVGPGLGGRRRVNEIHRNHASRLVLSRQRHRKLNEALGPNEVHPKRRPQRIAQIFGAGNLQPPSPKLRVIHGKDQRLSRPIGRRYRPADRVKQLSRLDPLFRVEPILGTPIPELPAGRGDQTGDRMSAQTDKLTQEMSPDAFDRTVANAGATEQFIDGIDQRGFCFVFFSVTGDRGVCLRCRTRFALSSMIHSTTSPLLNSMACAIAAGKLIYHCSLALRWMSCTLVG